MKKTSDIQAYLVSFFHNVAAEIIKKVAQPEFRNSEPTRRAVKAADKYGRSLPSEELKKVFAEAKGG